MKNLFRKIGCVYVMAFFGGMAGILGFGVHPVFGVAMGIQTSFMCYMLFNRGGQ